MAGSYSPVTAMSLDPTRAFWDAEKRPTWPNGGTAVKSVGHGADTQYGRLVMSCPPVPSVEWIAQPSPLFLVCARGHGLQALC